jgi:DNA-directed RNA polymerase specialized sigma24 family protein
MSPHNGWILQEEVVPRLRYSIPYQVNRIGSEDQEELVQDATCMAAKLLDNAEKANKTVTPGNIAYFTILHMKSGRRSYGASTSDVLGTGTQLNGRSQTYSMDEPVQADEGEEFTVNDVLSLDDEDPGQKAARKMDWDAFLVRLTVRERDVVKLLLTGLSGSEIARMFGVDPSTVRYFKNRLADKILAFMGPDILIEIRRRPGWKNSLNAERERLACRVDRRQ